MALLAGFTIFVCGSTCFAKATGPDFARDVRPILSQHCFKCHGPDKQKGGIRFDQRESVIRPAKSDAIAIVPGKADESEMLLRITSKDDDDVMPPREGGNKALNPTQIDILRTWVAAGAEYQAHWAYVKPVKAPLPMVEPPGTHPVDAFVRATLTQEKLTASPPASLATLCRRLHLDLVGLPPSPEDVDAFVAAGQRDRADAVAKLVDRLLASPRFGEKWSRHWLDLARYGDSAGYQHDDEMPLWLFRDWVVRAFNNDMPFDEFTRQQIAGDLLPNATLEQRIATGFHRGATVTLGADQNFDELRAQLVWDRVNTVGTTWLASSLECAQCHTHKFDPISHQEYYQLYAYFNRTVPDLTKEPGSHYFITGGILEMPVNDERQARTQSLINEFNAEVAKMISVDVSLDGAGGASLRRIFTGPPEFRTPERVYYYLNEEFRGTGPKEIAPHLRRIRELGRELMAIRPPRALVLAEDPNPPMTHIFLRGNVRTLGAEVQPGTLSMLHPAPKDAPPNRLGLAQWLASRENPLTARVMVNRWWAELFGQGLVTTPEDFGLQGDFPSHPELLDWLAVEFMDSGWSMKRLVKFVVTSATYQQSSKSTAASLARDPQNRLLTRGPRHRLDAELVRDNALAIAGLLHHEIGGPPVAATRADAKKAQEVFSWRRGIYVRQQRGEPYATFSSFDAPDRFACSARRSRTNTPLQALAVLNEPTFFEAATRLAERTENLKDFNERLVFMFKLCLARFPQPSETATLLDLFETTKRAGTSEPDTWRLIANVLLNLDETITKE